MPSSEKTMLFNRPQTTQRRLVPWILTDEDKAFQWFFLDTPGIQVSKEQFGCFSKSHEIHERINSEAFSALHSADVILRDFFDPTRPYGAEGWKNRSSHCWNRNPSVHWEFKQSLKRRVISKNIDIRIDSTTKKWSDVSSNPNTFPQRFPHPSDYYTDQSMDLRIWRLFWTILFNQMKPICLFRRSEPRTRKPNRESR